MEIELKLSMAPDTLQRLIRSPLWTVLNTRDQRQRLQTRYFDTPDGQLLRAGVALRVRRAGRRWVQTIKGGGAVSAGLHRRHEVETAVPGPRPELARFPVEVIVGPLADPAVIARLTVVFETRFDRLTRTVLTPGGAEVEVAFDRGAVSAAGRESPLCEVELELRSGPETELLSLARGIVRHGGWLDDTSKAARGYRLAWPELATTRAPVWAAVADVPRVRAWSHLLQQAVTGGLAHLHANAPGVRDGDTDPGYVHQMRVACRRLRTILAVSQRRDDHPLTAHLLGELRWLANTLGPARDWDVLLGETLPEFVSTCGVPTGYTRLLADAAAARQHVRREAVSALRSARYGELLIDLMMWLQRPTPRGCDKASLAARDELARKHRRVLRLGQPQLLVDDAARHRLRLACKKLRYTSESLAPAFATRTADRYINALADLQRCLGGLNDAAVAAERLDSLPAGRAEQARRAVKRHLDAIARTGLEPLAACWAQFCATKPFWK